MYLWEINARSDHVLILSKNDLYKPTNAEHLWYFSTLNYIPDIYQINWGGNYPAVPKIQVLDAGNNILEEHTADGECSWADITATYDETNDTLTIARSSSVPVVLEIWNGESWVTYKSWSAETSDITIKIYHDGTFRVRRDWANELEASNCVELIIDPATKIGEGAISGTLPGISIKEKGQLEVGEEGSDKYIRFGLAKLHGEVTIRTDSVYLSGWGTNFLAELKPGDLVYVNGEIFTIQWLTSNITARIDRFPSQDYSGPAYLVQGLTMAGTLFFGQGKNKLIFEDSSYYIDEDGIADTIGGEVSFINYPSVESMVKFILRTYDFDTYDWGTHHIFVLRSSDRTASKHFEFMIEVVQYKDTSDGGQVNFYAGHYLFSDGFGTDSDQDGLSDGWVKDSYSTASRTYGYSEYALEIDDSTIVGTAQALKFSNSTGATQMIYLETANYYPIHFPEQVLYGHLYGKKLSDNTEPNGLVAEFRWFDEDYNYISSSTYNLSLDTEWKKFDFVGKVPGWAASPKYFKLRIYQNVQNGNTGSWKIDKLVIDIPDKLIASYFLTSVSEQKYGLRIAPALVLDQQELPSDITKVFHNVPYGAIAVDTNGNLRFTVDAFTGWKYISIPEKGSSDPAALPLTPLYPGQIYVNTSTKKIFIAKGTDGPEDWVAIN